MPTSPILWLLAGKEHACIWSAWTALLLLRTPFGLALRALAMTCAHFSQDQICTQVDPSFSPFGHPTQVNASWLTSINLLLANKIEYSLPWNVFFLRHACTCQETCQSVCRPNASLYASSTCIHLRLLAGYFGQGFILLADNVKAMFHHVVLILSRTPFDTNLRLMGLHCLNRDDLTLVLWEARWPHMVSALVSGSRGPGSSPCRGHCVVFLGNTLYSHSAPRRI